MAPRLIDPVHFFNARGVSVLTQEFQDKRILELEKELAETQRRLRSAVMRLRELGESPIREKA